MNKSLCALFVTLTFFTVPASAQESSFRSQDSSYSIFLLLKTGRSWLDLSVPERFKYLETSIQPILDDHPEVKMTFWDTEHFNARVSDVLLFETQNLGQYQSVIEKLRESRFWDDYFQVLEILPGIENAYAEYYEQEAVGQKK